MNIALRQSPQVVAILAIGLFALSGESLAAEDAKFAFMSPPDEDLLRIYWLNKQTGQVGSCFYQPSDDKANIGSTKCYSAGEGAGPLGPGRYDFRKSFHKDEGSVFRVNLDTGDISICWVRHSKVVCTAPAR
jgi:hypothetical protein